ncbi:hypothetical protein C8K36_102343 [Rhodococcus sp. OK519]|nr:hypothetical protein C8K36_102343 [Rhodococcus sp. OK519]
MDAHADDDPRAHDGSAAGEYVSDRRGRGGFDPEADAIARAARYQFRQRSMLGLVFASLLTAGLAIALTPVMWWVCALSVAGLGFYLAYLRRQVHMEHAIRRRRMARVGRSRLGVESLSDDELRLVPSRLRRPGAVVLEVDDGDPAFDHLEFYDAEAAEYGYDNSRYGDEGLRRVSGQ